MSQTQNHLNTYDDDVVRKFLLATMIWAGVAFLVGIIIALEMAYWPANLNLEWITFGRLRPLHTNAAIFAFAGNIIFAGIYHSTQRLLKTRLFNDLLSNMHFWGWQLIIVSAALTLPFGYTQGKEYAELEWPIDIAIAVVWVIFAVNFFGTLVKRKEKHIYVAIWFYIATIVTVALLHITNSIAIPVGPLKSYSAYAGIQDALIQWWYGHNAVAFFLTTPFLGLMYYYMPKIANRPVYSYRLSIVHFWALVFLYIWAGPHHLLYTALPEWAQTLGMIFSLMLWAPSWGGMINGLLTLRGAWGLLRTEPTVKFLVAAITFYAMSTFEGPLLSIKSVNALAHYTDWIVGHVHAGALGWNGFMAFGIMYYLVPKLWKTELHSKDMATNHFWVGTTGILLYYVTMWAAGLTQGFMWREINAEGNLANEFIYVVSKISWLYWARVIAGVLYFIGYVLFAYNMWKTIASSKAHATETITAPAHAMKTDEKETGHRKLEGMVTVFTVLALVSILVGSVIEIIPTMNIAKYTQPEKMTEPWTALEIAGRDIYIREGCYLCHSQQVRPMAAEVLRYGSVSTIEDSMWDHPFQWGSKRTGPDLAREGTSEGIQGLRSADWHFKHMFDPRFDIKGSIMPRYPWLYTANTDFLILRKKLSVLKTLGVPYTEDQSANADIQAQKDAKIIADKLISTGSTVLEEQKAGLENKEIVALIAYLTALGNKVKK
jgi:cytochrome c oxidase cbb3-type subunit I/II